MRISKVITAVVASLVAFPGYGFMEKATASNNNTVLPSTEQFELIKQTLEVEKQREIDRLSSVANSSTRPSERISACIALAVYFQDIDPQLSQHYIAKARLAKDPFSDSSYLHAAASYFRVHNTINFQLTGYESELIKLSQNDNLPWKMKKYTFELLLDHYWQKGENSGFIDTFEAYYEKVPSFTIAELQIRRAIDIYKTSKQTNSYFEKLERLTARFPLSTHSQWAFEELAKHSAKANGEYAFEFSFLRKLYLNTSVDQESRKKVLALLDGPIKRSIHSPAKPLTDMEKLSFLVRIRAYDEVIDLAKKVEEKDNAYLASRAKIWRGFALGRLGYFVDAIKIFKAAEEKGDGLSGFFSEAYAEILMRSGRHKKAAERYEALLAKQDSYRLRWYLFWNLYKSKQIPKALSLLKSKRPIFSEDQKQADSRNYWNFKLTSNSKKGPDEFEFNGIRRHYYKTLFETHHNPKGSIGSRQNAKANTGEITLTLAPFAETEAQTIERIKKLMAEHEDERTLLASNGDIEFRKQIEKMNDAQLLEHLSISRAIAELSDLSFKREVNIIASGLGVDPLLIFSLIKAESSFNPVAMSSIGARGLMQIMPYTALKLSSQIGDKSFKLEDLADPVTSVVYGSIYFNMLLKAYNNNIFVAIAAYNAGPDAVNQWLQGCHKCSTDDFVELIPFKETRAYVKKVVSFYSEYRFKSEQDMAFDSLPILPSVPREIASSLF